MRELRPDDGWDFPVRLLGGLHYLVLSGRSPGWAWDDVRETLRRERDWLTRFTAEQSVQTNEVRRCWALLPAFLSLAERPLDLLELGSSGGLNLVWDRYRYRYAAGIWGPSSSPLELTGEERGAVPASLLGRRVEIARRRGIELDPVDISSEDGVRLLSCFVWADQPERLERLSTAVEIARAEPPELLRGDYVELLPSVLADRIPGTLAVVFQTASTVYLSRERYAELRRIVDDAEPPVAWLSTRRFDEEETELEGGFELELRRDERGPARLVARMGYHGQWLEWRPASLAGRGSRRAKPGSAAP